MKASPTAIVERLQALSFEGTFNPYSERCTAFDHLHSPSIRSSILRNILECAAGTTVDALWIGRDLGHKGGRRTGLALTDDLSFEKHLARWEIETDRPTQGSYVKEQTATAIWEMLDEIPEDVFLWNVFPLHPYPAGNEFSNRAHTAKERQIGEEVLRLIFDLIQPARIVAIGNDAAKSARSLWPNAEICHVRHPSYGGQAEFRERIQDIYGFRTNERQGCLI